MSTHIVVATINAQGVTDSARLTADSVMASLPGISLAGLQEVKNLRGRRSLRRLFSRATTGVHQSQASAAEGGVALIWSKADCRSFARGITLGVTPGDGDAMLARYLAWADLVVEDHLIIRAVAAHRPPKRYRDLWPAFDAAMAELVKRSRYPVVIFIDNNSPEPPARLRALGMRTYGVGNGIDLVIADAKVPVIGRAFNLPRTNSDHLPVAVRIRMRP